LRRFLPLLLALALLAPGPAAAVFDLAVTRTTAGRVPVGVLGVVGAPGLEDQLAEARQVLHADLRRSGLFQGRDLGLEVAEPPDRVLGPIRIRDIGVQQAVEVLLWVQLKREQGKLVLEGHIYDAARGKRVAGRRYTGDEAMLRTMVHRYIGELVHLYTGEYGITHSRIAFVSDLTGAKEIYVMDYDGYAPRRVTSDRSIALTPALAPEAKRLLYTGQKSGAWRLYEVELATGNRSAMRDLGGLAISPAWHPRGDGYAVAVSMDGNQELVHVTGSGRIRRLTADPSDDVSPAWSPDGEQIAFTSNRGGSPQVYVMSGKGGRARRISFGGNYNSEPSWSPAGDLIAYTCRRGEWFKICVVPARGGASREITTGAWDDEGPNFSPDGRHIAFSSNRGGRHDIYMMDTDGRGVERLTYNGANNTAPSWADTVPR
jgi:TolB protein